MGVMLIPSCVAMLAPPHVTAKVQKGSVVTWCAGYDDQPAAARWDQLAVAPLDQRPSLFQQVLGQLVDTFVVAQVHGAASAAFGCANDAAETGGGARQERERKMEKCPGDLGPALQVPHEVLDNMVLLVECCSPEGILLG